MRPKLGLEAQSGVHPKVGEHVGGAQVHQAEGGEHERDQRPRDTEDEDDGAGRGRGNAALARRRRAEAEVMQRGGGGRVVFEASVGGEEGGAEVEQAEEDVARQRAVLEVGLA